MHNRIKVIQIDVVGWWGPKIDNEKLAIEIDRHEAAGWKLVTMTATSDGNRGVTDTLVCVFRQE